uniref:Uncharacterized protein n=1 Tax=Brassica oleracea var. oleracea TaxID=109376 RepID=A0A0D3DJN8_BRAOL
MGDILQVTGFYNSAPEFKFAQRKNMVISIQLEATTDNDISKALTQATCVLESSDFNVDGIHIFARYLHRSRKKLPVRRGGCREHEPRPVAEGDEIRSTVFIGYDRDECELVPGDDCEAIVDDPGGEIEEYENEVSEEEGCGVQTEEEACEVFSSPFGDVASNDGDENDESGDDDCWNEDNTPDPVSYDDEEEEARREACEDAASADEI